MIQNVFLRVLCGARGDARDLNTPVPAIRRTCTFSCTLTSVLGAEVTLQYLCGDPSSGQSAALDAPEPEPVYSAHIIENGT